MVSGYEPKEGDRVRAIIFKKPRGPGGKGGGFDARYVCGMNHSQPHDDDTLLKGAVTLALEAADALQCASVALPAISSGIFGFPVDRCADLILEAAAAFAPRAAHVRRVAVTNIDAPTVAAVVGAFRRRFGPACVDRAAADRAATQVLTDKGGRELRGPLLIDVDRSADQRRSARGGGGGGRRARCEAAVALGGPRRHGRRVSLRVGGVAPALIGHGGRGCGRRVAAPRATERSSWTKKSWLGTLTAQGIRRFGAGRARVRRARVRVRARAGRGRVWGGSAGEVIQKQACPRTTPDKARELRAKVLLSLSFSGRPAGRGGARGSEGEGRSDGGGVGETWRERERGGRVGERE